MNNPKNTPQIRKDAALRFFESTELENEVNITQSLDIKELKLMGLLSNDPTHIIEMHIQNYINKKCITEQLKTKLSKKMV